MDADGWVPVVMLAAFPKVARENLDLVEIIEALAQSPKLLDSDLGAVDVGGTGWHPSEVGLDGVSGWYYPWRWDAPCPATPTSNRPRSNPARSIAVTDALLQPLPYAAIGRMYRYMTPHSIVPARKCAATR